MALDQDKDSWNKLNEEIKNRSIAEKKSSLKEYYKNSGIIEKSQDLLLDHWQMGFARIAAWGLNIASS